MLQFKNVFVFLQNLGLQNHTLNKSKSSHLWSLRVKPGNTLQATDLNGTLASIQIQEVNKSKQTLSYLVKSKEQARPYPKKILYQAQIDRLYLEKLIEVLPLARITKLIIFRSQNSLKQQINIERLDKILTRSCEQSESLWKPEIIVTDTSLEEILKTQKPLVLEQTKDSRLKQKNHVDSVLVGPEGGWSDAEKSLFKDLNTQIYSLGKVNLPAWIAGYTYFCH